MAEREWNVARRNAVLEAAGALVNGGNFIVYDEERTGADQAAGGDVLVDIDVPTPAYGSAAAGSQTSVQWVGEAVLSGVPRAARLLNSAATHVQEYDAGEGSESVVFTGLDSGVLPAGAVVVVEMTQSIEAGDAVP